MSLVNPVFPIDTKNSIGFIVHFFGGKAGLVGDSVHEILSRYRAGIFFDHIVTHG